MTQHRPGDRPDGQSKDWPQESPQESPEDWQGVLRAKGYRLTAQRASVLRAVERLGHATPDEVLKQVHTESAAVNLSTVYRNLELLEELGLVRHTHLTDRAPTYHSTTQPQHVHLVCRVCRSVIDATPEDFDGLTAVLQERHGFTPDIGHLTVFGTCGECLATTDTLSGI